MNFKGLKLLGRSIICTIVMMMCLPAGAFFLPGNSKCETNNGGCEHICKSKFLGRVCLCKPGFQLQPDRRTCKKDGPVVLVDPCDTNKGGCTQYCTNRYGTAVCSCRPGYKLQTDKRICLRIETNCRQHTETCNGRGSCKDLSSDKYLCNCTKKGYIGEDCQYHFRLVLQRMVKLEKRDAKLKVTAQCQWDSRNRPGHNYDIYIYNENIEELSKWPGSRCIREREWDLFCHNILFVNRKQNRNKWECLAFDPNNRLSPYAVSEVLQSKIRWPPSKVLISHEENEYAYLGIEYHMTCRTDSSNPPVRIKWMRKSNGGTFAEFTVEENITSITTQLYNHEDYGFSSNVRITIVPCLLDIFYRQYWCLADGATEGKIGDPLYSQVFSLMSSGQLYVSITGPDQYYRFDSFTLTCHVPIADVDRNHPNFTLTYSWLFTGVKAGITENVFVISPLLEENAGVYECSAKLFDPMNNDTVKNIVTGSGTYTVIWPDKTRNESITTTTTTDNVTPNTVTASESPTKLPQQQVKLEMGHVFTILMAIFTPIVLFIVFICVTFRRARRQANPNPVPAGLTRKEAFNWKQQELAAAKSLSNDTYRDEFTRVTGCSSKSDKTVPDTPVQPIDSNFLQDESIDE